MIGTSNMKLSSSYRSRFDGYGYLLELHARCKDLFLDEIRLDFSKVNWFDANLCAVLGALINTWQRNLNSVELINLSKGIADVFSKNWFLKSFGKETILDNNSTTVTYKRFKLEETNVFIPYVFNDVLSRAGFVDLSFGVKKELTNNFLEIFMNAKHGISDEVYCCGQFYPQAKIPKLDFTIVDIGQTIKENVNKHLDSNLTGEDTIKWALRKGNTTKQKDDGVPGGLGLDRISNFIKLNRGVLQIVSNDGFFELNDGRENFRTFANGFSFPGTIVNVEFNLGDTSHYILKSEIPQNIIF
jgi:anti-anti-sigma regulatory factor